MDIEASAIKLSKNPLGIIALFLLLIYGFATLLFGMVGSVFSTNQKWWFVIFLVIFPVIVLFVFAYLVINHHQKLYAPSDYKDEKNFFGYASPKEQQEKYEQEELETSASSEVVPEKEKATMTSGSVVQNFIARREKIEQAENFALDYYEKRFNYDIDRNVFFKIGERKIYFDGLAEKRRTLNFFEIKYTPSFHVSRLLLDRIVLDAITVKDFMEKSGKYPNYRYRLKLIFVVDSENDTAISDMKERVHKMIDTEVINITIRIFTLDQLKRDL